MAVYKIVIEDKTSESFNPVAGQETPSTTSQASSSNRKISMNDIGLFVAYRQVKPFVSQVISNEVQKVGLRTGSNREQEKANFYHNVASKTFSFAESVAIGAKLGGGWGALAGAVLSGAHEIISYVNKVDNLNIKASIENESNRLNLIRAGAGGSRRQ